MPPRRGPHRGTDMRDTMAELAERAQIISQEAGTKVAAAMRDVISAGAGIAGFAIESARDLVQFMVRRGQMTQDEADKLIREAEAAHAKRSVSERGRPTASKIAADKAAVAKAEAAARNAAAAAAYHEQLQARKLSSMAKVTKPEAPEKKAAPPAAPKAAKAEAKPASKAPPKSAPKPTAKTASKAAPAKKSAPAKAAKRPTAKPAKKGKR
jgi:polyhydroxyalkanoate synthesis regulator phasin